MTNIPPSANVGLSLGGPFGDTSMSGHFRIASKLVICAMMIRGRHRGLPYGLDRAITLPHEDMPGSNNIVENQMQENSDADSGFSDTPLDHYGREDPIVIGPAGIDDSAKHRQTTISIRPIPDC